MYSSGAGSFYDHQIDGSLRFADDDNAYLNRTPSSAGNRKTWTFSWWFKPSMVPTGAETFFSAAYSYQSLDLNDNNNGQIRLFLQESPGYYYTWTPKYRDPSAWYHGVIRYDTTQATDTNRVRLYINGEEVTDLTSVSRPPQNWEGGFNNSILHRIGVRASPTENYYDGYMAEVNFIDGQALAPTSFGETKSGVWIPKAYSGSYGTNGFHLEFNGNSNDSSGNGNNWTANNISSYDYVPDSPTNNFATWNPLGHWNWAGQNGSKTYAQGNLQFTGDNFGTMTGATIGVSSGKWYMEYRMTSGDNYDFTGVLATRTNPTGNRTYGWYSDKIAYYDPITNAESNLVTGLTPATSGEIIGVALDLDNYTIKWYKDNSLVATVTSVNPDTYTFLAGGAAGTTQIANFGQDSTFLGNETAGGNSDENGYGDFAYAPPSGYLALCTANLTVAEGVDPALDASPQDYFNTVLWTGNGATNRNITGVGFQPDFLWIKNRSNGGNNHHLFNAVIGMPNHLSTDLVYSESTATNKATAFLSDGFTIQDHSSVNASGQSYVAWNWKANGSGSSNTSGSITSTVSANTDVGFSIVSYTGTGSTATVGHGLGKAPSFIVTKCRTQSSDWPCYHASEGATRYGNINEAASWSTNSSPWNNTAPTSSVFTVGGSYGTNWPSQPLIAYCFAEIEGYSSIGSYIGNGSSDGSFVYTGFRPAMIIYKSPEVAEVWYIHDDKRIGYNPENRGQYIQSDVSEYDLDRIDILSNGFKLRSTDSDSNFSGRKYIYMAFAENPFKYANAR